MGRDWLLRSDLIGLCHQMLDPYTVRFTQCRNVYGVNPNWENLEYHGAYLTCLFCIAAMAREASSTR